MTLLPPAQYDVPPPMPVIEHVLPFNELQRTCGAPAPFQVLGCSHLMRRNTFRGPIVYCKVYVVDADLAWWRGDDGQAPARLMTRDDQGAIRRHELAHCNGWRHE